MLYLYLCTKTVLPKLGVAIVDMRDTAKISIAYLIVSFSTGPLVDHAVFTTHMEADKEEERSKGRKWSLLVTQKLSTLLQQLENQLPTACRLPSGHSKMEDGVRALIQLQPQILA